MTLATIIQTRTAALINAFVHRMSHIKVTATDMQAYDVDHLLPRARTGNDQTLLRLEAPLLGHKPPMGIGAGNAGDTVKCGGKKEDAVVKEPSYRRQGRRICPPSTLQDPVRRARLGRELASLGISQKEAQDGLDSLLGHIARNLR